MPISTRQPPQIVATRLQAGQVLVRHVGTSYTVEDLVKRLEALPGYERDNGLYSIVSCASAGLETRYGGKARPFKAGSGYCAIKKTN